MAVNPFLAFRDRYTRDAALFVREVLGADPDPWQEAFLDSISRPDPSGVTRVSIRSAHRIGKSCGLAFTFWWWACTRFPQKTMVTAASAPQLFDALVPEIKTWYTRLPDAIRSVWEIQVEGIFHKGAPDESFMSFRTSKAEAPESAAGIHSEHVLYLNDEASGIPDAVFEAQIGSFADPNVLYILAGNPVRTSGLFHDSHMKREVAANWRLFHVSAFDTPRVGRALIEEAEARWGVDSNAYRVRVLGEFPKSEDDAVIPFEWIESALTREVDPYDVLPIWGLDVAWGGEDATALAIRKGNTLVEPVTVWRGLDPMETAGRVKAKWDECLGQPEKRPSDICVDAIGLGAGTAMRLAEMGLPARAINVSELPSLKGQGHRLKDELWLRGRDWFEARDCNICNDLELSYELGAQLFDEDTSDGKVRVKSKKQMKRLGKKSPNRADAFLLTLAVDALAASGSNGRQPVSWKQPLRRNLMSVV